MKFRRLLLVFTIGVSLLLLSSTCEAQWRVFNQTSQKPFRLTGHGWGAGYHWKTPGHDSSYYMPYSHHNTFRASDWHYGISASQFQGPQYLAPNHSVLIVSQPLNPAEAHQPGQRSDGSAKRESVDSIFKDIETEKDADAEERETD
jgi:hypothetical protein